MLDNSSSDLRPSLIASITDAVGRVVSRGRCEVRTTWQSAGSAAPARINTECTYPLDGIDLLGLSCSLRLLHASCKLSLVLRTKRRKA